MTFQHVRIFQGLEALRSWLLPHGLVLLLQAFWVVLWQSGKYGNRGLANTLLVWVRWNWALHSAQFDGDIRLGYYNVEACSVAQNAEMPHTNLC